MIGIPRDYPRCELDSYKNRPTFEMRALQRTCEILGGEKALGRYLRVPSTELIDWLHVAKASHKHDFICAIDVVLDDSARHDYVLRDGESDHAEGAKAP